MDGKEKRAGVENNSNLKTYVKQATYYRSPQRRKILRSYISAHAYPHEFGAGGSIKTNIVISRARGEALAKRARGRGCVGHSRTLKNKLRLTLPKTKQEQSLAGNRAHMSRYVWQICGIDLARARKGEVVKRARYCWRAGARLGKLRRTHNFLRSLAGFA